MGFFVKLLTANHCRDSFPVALDSTTLYTKNELLVLFQVYLLRLKNSGLALHKNSF